MKTALTISTVLFILLITTGCVQLPKHQLNYTIDLEKEVILDASFDFEPLPSLENKSKLQIQLIPKASDISVEMNFITEENYKLMPPDSIKKYISLEQIGRFEKKYRICSDWPYGIDCNS